MLHKSFVLWRVFLEKSIQQVHSRHRFRLVPIGDAFLRPYFIVPLPSWRFCPPPLLKDPLYGWYIVGWRVVT